MLDELDGPSEVLFVDDCSTDGTRELLLGLQRDDPRVRVIRFARNFGHQVAISAGLDFAVGEAVIVMDADLQDPPEVVPQLVAKWREGFEVVYAVRKRRHGERWLKRVTASAYYRMLQKLSSVEIPVDVGDFRLVDRRALDTFRSMRERNRYVRGMFSWIGFKQTGVEYERAERYAGRPEVLVPEVAAARDGRTGQLLERAASPRARSGASSSRSSRSSPGSPLSSRSSKARSSFRAGRRSSSR